MLAQRQRDVIAERHGIEQRRALEQHPHFFADAVHLIFVQLRNILAFDVNMAGTRLQ